MVTNEKDTSVDEPDLIEVETRNKLNAIVAFDRQQIDQCSFAEVIACGERLLDENLEKIPRAKKRKMKDLLAFLINGCHVQEWICMNRKSLLKEISKEYPDTDFTKVSEREQHHQRHQIREAVGSLLQFEKQIFLALNNPSHRPKGVTNRNNPDAIIYSQIISEASQAHYNDGSDFWLHVKQSVEEKLEQKKLSVRGDNSIIKKKSFYHHMNRISKDVEQMHPFIPKKPRII